MSTTTITALTAVNASDLDDTALLPVDDNDSHTRKATVAQLRTQLYSAVTMPAAPYGMFSSTSTQAIANVTLAQAITYTNTEASSGGVTLSNSSRINLASAGTYLVTFSGIADTASGAGANKHLELWLRINGTTAVDRSNTVVEIVSASVEMTVAVSFIYTFTAGQYFELMTCGDDVKCEWLATAAGSNPTRPASPSVIVTVNKIAG